jgi:hypothetical protein
MTHFAFEWQSPPIQKEPLFPMYIGDVHEHHSDCNKDMEEHSEDRMRPGILRKERDQVLPS